MASSAVLHRRVGLATIFLEISCFDLTPAKILELERAKFGLPIRMPSTSSKRTGPLSHGRETSLVPSRNLYNAVMFSSL